MKLIQCFSNPSLFMELLSFSRINPLHSLSLSLSLSPCHSVFVIPSFPSTFSPFTITNRFILLQPILVILNFILVSPAPNISNVFLSRSYLRPLFTTPTSPSNSSPILPHYIARLEEWRSGDGQRRTCRTEMNEDTFR